MKIRPISRNVRNALAGAFAFAVGAAGINTLYDTAHTRGAEQATQEITEALRDKEACTKTTEYNCFAADYRLKKLIGFVPEF